MLLHWSTAAYVALCEQWPLKAPRPSPGLLLLHDAELDMRHSMLSSVGIS